jgi:hypothetical protein
LHALRIVDVEHGNGGAADLRATHENGSLPLEVALPELTAGVEKAHDLARARVSAAQVRAFVQIAPMAAPAPVLRGIRPAVLLGENVFDVESGRRGCAIREVTVLASLTRPCPDELAKGAIHSAPAERLRRTRAFA